MNMGHEEDELMPYSEPEADLSDLKRIEMLVGLGYNRADIEDSLKTQKYDDVFATYLLLGRRSTDVSTDVSFLLCSKLRATRKSMKFSNSRRIFKKNIPSKFGMETLKKSYFFYQY